MFVHKIAPQWKKIVFLTVVKKSHEIDTGRKNDNNNHNNDEDAKHEGK